jgi:uncharacterized protein (TIGR02145 family)
MTHERKFSSVFRIIILFMILCGFQQCRCDLEEPKPLQGNLQLNPPMVETLPAEKISDTSAFCGGIIRSDTGIILLSGGICWDTQPVQELLPGHFVYMADSGRFTAPVSGLKPGTRYYMKAFSIWENKGSKDTVLGNQVELKTADLCDVDGNTYESVVIGAQVWMKENLKVRHYRNGDSIPNIKGTTAWKECYIGACADYEGKRDYSKVYGLCYNGYILKDPRGLCPTGWHIPSGEEWQTLIDHLGGNEIAGGKLKATGTRDRGTGLWKPPNFNASNSSGFTALPAGHRNLDASFHEDGKSAYWWTSYNDPGDYHRGKVRGIEFYGEFVYDSAEMVGNAFSIRCIKD